MLWKNFFSICVISILLHGCVVIPLPPDKHQFSKEIEQQIEVGKITRNEIIKLIGKPKLSQNETQLIYRLPRETMNFLVLVGGMTPGAIGGDIIPLNRSDYTVLFEFNSMGILKRYEAVIYESNTYETIATPSLPTLTTTDRIKLFATDKKVYDLPFVGSIVPIGFTNISLSRDGKYLAAVGYRYKDLYISPSIYFVNLETNRSKILKNDAARTAFFSPDLSKVLINEHTMIKVLDINTSNTVFKHDKGFWGKMYSTTAFNADASLLAAGNCDGTISIWDYLNNKSLVVLKYANACNLASIALSTKGPWLAANDADNNLMLWDTTTSVLVDSRKAAQGSLAFSPNDKILAINSTDHIQLWQIDESASPKLQLIDLVVFPGKIWKRGPKLPSYSLTFSRDGKYIAAANGNLMIYDIQKRRKVLLIENYASPERIDSIAFSNDGKYVVGGTSTGVYAWKLPDE